MLLEIECIELTANKHYPSFKRHSLVCAQHCQQFPDWLSNILAIKCCASEIEPRGCPITMFKVYIWTQYFFVVLGQLMSRLKVRGFYSFNVRAECSFELMSNVWVCWEKTETALQQIDHLLFYGPPLVQRGQRSQWPHPAWVSTSWLHLGEVSSPGQVYHTGPSGGAHSYPTVRGGCTWKHTMGLNTSLLCPEMAVTQLGVDGFSLVVYEADVNILAHVRHQSPIS